MVDNIVGCLQSNEEDYFVKRRLLSVSSDVRHKINELEDIERLQSKGMKQMEFDGELIEVPQCFHSYLFEEANFKHKDGAFYVVPKEFKEPSSKWIEGFSEHAYVIFQKENGRWVSMCMRILGGDKYGDRIYASSTFYKTSFSDFSYSSKEYGKNRCPVEYQPYYNQMLEYIREVEGMENFNE